MREIVLDACKPKPLGSYLKALGIFRIVSEQCDRSARCCWRNDRFMLRSKLNEKDIQDFILNEYMPTPIISPWNGRAGFLEGESADESNRKGAIILRTITASKGERFGLYRSLIEAIRCIPIVGQLNQIRTEVKALEAAKKKKQPYEEERLKLAKEQEKTLKNQLVTALRGELDDQFLPWFDVCLVLAGTEVSAAPLLGSGGNEGSMDYSINHLKLLTDLIDPDTDRPTTEAEQAIDSALFQKPALIAVHGNPGFLNPFMAGGVNMSTGFSGEVVDNAWDTVLMLEGALLFAATATRRHDTQTPGKLSQPFMFDALCAGHGGVAPDEGARPEFWAPLWDRPVILDELRALLSEGRATLRRRRVRNGLDMARAAASLGVDRGLAAFQRYGLFERRGQGYFVAAPLGRVVVTSNPQSEWIDELEQGDWLARFRRFARGDKVARRFILLRKRLEDALFEFAGAAASPAQVQALLALLGEIQYALSGSTKACQKVAPVPLLTARWTLGADDGTPVYRIARALASLRGEEGKPLPLRAQLFPVHPRRHDWIEVACKTKGGAKDTVCGLRLAVPRAGRLVDTLIALLGRRLWLAERLGFRDKPFSAGGGVGLDDLDAFGRDARMDQAIVALLPGLVLCKDIQGLDPRAGGAAAPAAFGLLKLVLTPDAWLRKLAGLPADRHMLVPPGLVNQLASGHPGQAHRAVEAAWRRLQGSGLVPLMPRAQCPEVVGIDPRRLAAALLIPLSYGATGVLARSLLMQQDVTAEPT